MKLLIGIATYQRIEKLKRLLESLKKQTYDNFIISVICDDKDFETEKYIRSLEDYKLGHIGVTVQDSRRYVIGAWNTCVQGYVNTFADFDGFIGLCDDVELFPNCFEMLVWTMQKRFPDYDGVIGISQECPGRPDYTYKPYGQTLMGRKFIERYREAGYQICCPYYKHFYQDEEMWKYATSLGKAYHSLDAKLNHYHPGFKPEEKDNTHFIVRTGGVQQGDTAIFNRRQSEGKLWGRTWEQ